ncbi:MAG: heme-binding protein [Proteobacteria bacterium]|nr:heme-binding protein [Pseudomonadota bacterium]MBI3496426.1 heme-binding protein [Pseudomonadota bacterium]
MRRIGPLVASTGLALLMGSAADAQLLERKDLSYAIAKTIAEGAVESCQAKGYRVSAVVVNRGGETLVAFRGDGSGPHTMENARRKAYTAMTFRQPTTAYAKRFADNDPTVRQQVTLPNVIAIGGGLPIKVGEDVIGGAGVSGSPGVDEPCVQAGIDKVADLLK